LGEGANDRAVLQTAVIGAADGGKAHADAVALDTQIIRRNFIAALIEAVERGGAVAHHKPQTQTLGASLKRAAPLAGKVRSRLLGAGRRGKQA
jgi:hypothetical protein